VADGTFLALPSQIYTGLRLPAQVLQAGQRGAIEALAVTPEGLPAPGTAIQIAIYRRTWTTVEETGAGGEIRTILLPRDERVRAETIAAGDDGTARLSIALRGAGEYRVAASAADAEGRRVTSAANLWVAAPGFVDWRAAPAGQLIADRQAYRPGDKATLLLATPHTDATALLTIARDGATSAEVRQLSAGQPLTVTLTAEDAPAARVSVLLANPSALDATAAFTIATATLPVLATERAITVTLKADRAAYAPGDTATLTVTTVAADGAGVSADVILNLASARAAPRHGPAEVFGIIAPPPLATALLPGAPAPPGPAPAPLPALPPAATLAPLPGPLAYWNPMLRTGADGVLTLTVQLPPEPGELRALAWVAGGADRFGQATTTLAITRALELRLEAPAFLRAADEALVIGLVRNTTDITQTAELALDAAGLSVRGAALSQRVAVAPRATTRVAWPALVSAAAQAALSISLRPDAGPTQRVGAERPILPPIATPPISDGVELLREYLDPRSGRLLQPGSLRAGQLVRVRLTLVGVERYDRLTIEEPLPGGASLVEVETANLAKVTRDTGRLALTSEGLAPGIYQYTYLLRAVAPGRYSAPPAIVRAGDGEVIGAGNITRFEIGGQ
jgi:uncharacterized protein YfaS (alpha-2-macroglobulin family)